MKSTAEVVNEVFDANWHKATTGEIMALAVEMDRAQRAEPVDYVAKAEHSLKRATDAHSLKRATDAHTLNERRMLAMAEAQVYATLAAAQSQSRLADILQGVTTSGHSGDSISVSTS